LGNPIARQLSVLRRVRALHATATRTPGTADDAHPADAGAVAARPADRAAAGNPDPRAGHRRAVTAFAGHKPVAWPDLAGWLTLRQGRGGGGFVPARDAPHVTAETDQCLGAIRNRSASSTFLLILSSLIEK
jgi:hypothetical protein